MQIPRDRYPGHIYIHVIACDELQCNVTFRVQGPSPTSGRTSTVNEQVTQAPIYSALNSSSEQALILEVLIPKFRLHIRSTTSKSGLRRFMYVSYRMLHINLQDTFFETLLDS